MAVLSSTRKSPCLADNPTMRRRRRTDGVTSSCVRMDVREKGELRSRRMSESGIGSGPYAIHVAILMQCDIDWDRIRNPHKHVTGSAATNRFTTCSHCKSPTQTQDFAVLV